MPGKSKPGGGLKVSATYKRKKAKKTTTKKNGKGKGMY